MAKPKKGGQATPASLDPTDDSLFKSAEECFERSKPAIAALPASDVRVPSIDVQEAAIVALGIDGLLRAPGTKEKVNALIKAGFLDGKLLAALPDVARAAWFSRYRLLQVGATHSEAALPITLVEQALTLRRRMLKTLDYHLEDDAEAVARLEAIRAGSGHLDLANDLLAVADLYREYRKVIAHDPKNYRKDDETDARHTADKILRLLGAVTTPDQTLWKNHQARAFTLLLGHYEEARRAGRFLFHYDDGERLFPSLFSAARSAPSARVEKAEDTAAPGATEPGGTPA